LDGLYDKIKISEKIPGENKGTWPVMSVNPAMSQMDQIPTILARTKISPFPMGIVTSTDSSSNV
jgi:hypothetical protein